MVRDGTENFTYDAVGNRQTGPGPKDTGYQYNDANGMTQGRKIAYQYDYNGNQTTRTVPNVPDKTWVQTWDSENRLTKAEKTKGAEKRTVTYTYDPFNRRIGKQLTTVIDSVTSTSSWAYVYDNNSIVLEVYTAPSGSITKTWYTQGPGIDEHLAFERNGSNYFYHADGLGSIAAITDSGQYMVQSYTYDSFGLPTATTDFVNSYTFTGREWDPHAGLYYYRARYYDPMEGRFVSKDPIGFKSGDTNPYSYAMNNPTIWTDPSGLYYGQLPPPPPGYDPATWTTGQWDNGRWYLRSPDGRLYTSHPEDEGHWRHWGKNGPGGDDEGDWPCNPGKRKKGQKRLKPHQSDTDPSGDAPEWTPPADPKLFFWPFYPAGVPAGVPLRVPLRIPIPVW